MPLILHLLGIAALPVLDACFLLIRFTYTFDLSCFDFTAGDLYRSFYFVTSAQCHIYIKETESL